MHLFNSKAVLVCALSSSLGLLSAATSGIGVAMSEGNIFIDSSSAVGNATIFNGSTLETQSAASQIRLNDGARLQLASDSRGKVYSDHVDLQKGSARIAGYTASANGLSVRADGAASATVQMRDKGVVEVAALTGSVHVFNADGINVANLLPGRALDLKAQDAGATAAPADNSKKGKKKKAAAGAAGGAAAGGAAAGAGVATTTLVIAGVAVAAGAGVGIAAAAGGFSSNNAVSTPPGVSGGRLGAFN